MKKIVITDSPIDFKSTEVIVINSVEHVDNVPANWDNYSFEYPAFKITEYLSSIIDENSIVAIDYDINSVDRYILSHHIITTIDSGLVLFSETGAEPIRYDDDIGLLKNKCIQLISKEKLVKSFNDGDEAERLLSVYKNLFNYETYKEHYQNNLKIDNHQAINEWGAVKLLLNHGITLADIESSFTLPRTVFFKQKLKEHDIASSGIINTNSYVRNSKLQVERNKFNGLRSNINRIILIDDNATKGWEYVIRKFFDNATVDVRTNYTDALQILDYGLYDLIFLDLRLPTSNTDRFPNIENGLSLIEKIKDDEKSLHVPLIAFTASQKATTLNYIYEKGADAMYNKEDVSFKFEQSLDNYLDFLINLNRQILKGGELKYYWKHIVASQTRLLPEIIDSPSLLLKSRIHERLEMFYGLVKKNHEQSTYNDKKFHFSSEVLSFMTLWSVLNEIQECYYDKGGEFSHIQIEDVPNNPGHYTPLELNNWAIKNVTPKKYFIIEKPIFEETVASNGTRQKPQKDKVKRDLYSNLKYERTSVPAYKIESSYQFKRNYYEKLSFQIAYLILAKPNFSSSTKSNRALDILKASNDKRNTIYLTHGESISTSFHASKEQSKTLPSGIVKDLFNLIFFLLTGSDSLL